MADRHWRHWYKTKAWKRLREQALERDHWICKFCGCGLHRGKDGPRAAIADHIRPHKGDAELFFNPNNLQSLCKECHDRHKQKQEHTGILQGGDVHGFPTDPGHHWHR